MQSVRELISDFMSAAPGLGLSFASGVSDKTWTQAILGHFQARGESRGLAVYPRSDHGEYLMDLCWLKEDEKENPDHWMELALESEWSPWFDPIWYDFYKLLCVRSRLNLFICHADIRDRGGSSESYDSKSLASKLASEICVHRRRVGDEEYGIVTFPLDYREQGRIGMEAWAYDSRGKETWAGSRNFPDAGVPAR